MTRSSRARALVAVGAVVAALGTGGRANAQAPGDKAQQADKLFRDGQRLLDQGNLDEACKDFQQSNDLDAQLGTGLALAYCDEQHGKKAAAYAKYQGVERAAAAKGDEQRKAFAHQHAAAIEKDVPHLTLLGLPANATVNLDGQKVAYSTAGIPLGSGEHTVMVTAPLKKPSQSMPVSVGDAESGAKTLTIPSLDDDPDAIAAASGDRPGRRTAGFIIGGVGVAGIAVGSVFGILALGISSDCPDKNSCDQHYIDKATTRATISTIGFGVGVVGLGVGAWLILTSKGGAEPPPSAAAHVRPLVGPGSLGLEGTF